MGHGDSSFFDIDGNGRIDFDEGLFWFGIAGAIADDEARAEYEERNRELKERERDLDERERYLEQRERGSYRGGGWSSWLDDDDDDDDDGDREYDDDYRFDDDDYDYDDYDDYGDYDFEDEIEEILDDSKPIRVLTKVVGISHDGREFAWESAIEEGTFQIDLIREPFNDYDENAVAVYINEEHGGFIPRDDAKKIARLMDSGWDARVVGKNVKRRTSKYGDPYYVVLLTVEVGPDAED